MTDEVLVGPELPALELRGVAKRFGGVSAVDAVSMRVEQGTVHCVLGENGAGKSTLCNLIFGSLQPDDGEMLLYGQPYHPRRPADALGAGVQMVHQHFSLIPTMTALENLMLGRGRRITRGAVLARVAEVMDSYDLSVDLDARISDLSVGLRQQVEILRCLLPDPRLLILDEPTGVLGPREVESLMQTCRRIAQAGSAVMLVTHKLGDVMAAGDSATILRGGSVVTTMPLAGQTPAQLVPLIVGRELDTLGGASAAAIGVGATPDAAVKHRHVDPDVPRMPALELVGVTVSGRGGAPALDNVSLSVAAGEIVGIAGVEGNGQSELSAVISGSLSANVGSIRMNGVELQHLPPRARTRLGLGLIPEDRLYEGCIPGMSVAENLYLGQLRGMSRWGLLRRRQMRAAAGVVLAEHDIRGPGPGAPLSALSGGNQQKLVVARELGLDPLVCLVAAQPTRGLDLGAVDAVLGRIRSAAERDAGVLIISSELDELLAVCTRVLVMFRGTITGEIEVRGGSSRAALGELMMGATA